MLVEFEELATSGSSSILINSEQVVFVRPSPDANIIVITTSDREKCTVKGTMREVAGKLRGD